MQLDGIREMFAEGNEPSSAQIAQVVMQLFTTVLAQQQALQQQQQS